MSAYLAFWIRILLICLTNLKSIIFLNEIAFNGE